MTIDDFFSCPICMNVPAGEREILFNELDFKIKSFKKGDRIADQGDVVKGLHILLKGRVKTEMILESGMTLEIDNAINAPNPLLPAFLFASNNHFPVEVIALESCEVAIMSKDSVIKQFACSEAFLLGYITFTSNRINFLYDRLKFHSTKTIKGKLAKYCIEKHKDINANVYLNQTELAGYLGVARASLSRSISEMIDDGIIRLDGRTCKILDIVKLKKLILK